MSAVCNSKRLNDAISFYENHEKNFDSFNDIKEREERKTFFRRFAKERINELSFLEIIKMLWGARIWGNKEYLASKIINDNGLDKLSKAFTTLYSCQGTPGARYDAFKKEIKGFGPSMLTEIICHIDPENAGIWNDRAKKALSWLEIKGLPLGKYAITGEEYDAFNKVLKYLADELQKQGVKDVDMLAVDYFLWQIWDRFADQVKETLLLPKSPEKSASRHDELRDKIAAIGANLGFEVETEKLIAVGAKIDALWRAKIANLGTVSYVFEVQDRGSIDSLIVNLQRAQTNPTVQKLVIVSDSEQIKKIQEEIKSMPEVFRRATAYWEANDVDKTHLNLEQVSDSIAMLGLVNL